MILLTPPLQRKVILLFFSQVPGTVASLGCSGAGDRLQDKLMGLDNSAPLTRGEGSHQWEGPPRLDLAGGVRVGAGHAMMWPQWRPPCL